MYLCKEYSRQRESPQAAMNGEEASVVAVCVVGRGGWGGGGEEEGAMREEETGPQRKGARQME